MNNDRIKLKAQEWLGYDPELDELCRLYAENHALKHNSERVAQRLERTSDALMDTKSQRDTLLVALQDMIICFERWEDAHTALVMEAARAAVIKVTEGKV